MKNKLKKHRADLTDGNIPVQLAKLTFPMILGMLGMIVFNLTDTFFVGRLGPDQLAALSFTFPVVMVVQSIALGIGLGSSVLAARQAGGGNIYKLRRIATDSMFLGFIIILLISAAGIVTVRPLFSALGAQEPVLGYVKEYMSIWYLGVIAVVIPMRGNNIIRAIGDTKTPGLIMDLAAFVNVAIDPLLIFGIGPFPLGRDLPPPSRFFSPRPTWRESLPWSLKLSDTPRFICALFPFPTVCGVYSSWEQ